MDCSSQIAYETDRGPTCVASQIEVDVVDCVGRNREWVWVVKGGEPERTPVSNGHLKALGALRSLTEGILTGSVDGGRGGDEEVWSMNVFEQDQ